MRKLSLILAAGMGFASYANAAALLQWDFGSSNGNVATSDATTVDSSMQASTLSRGAGMPMAPCTFMPGYGSFTTDTSAAPGTLGGAVTANAYYEFGAAPQSGMKMSLSSVGFAGWQQNTHAGATIAVQYSLDGFTTAGVDVGSASGIHDGWAGAQYSVDLSGVAALQDATQSVTFRLYYYGFGGWEQRGLGQINGANADLSVDGVTAAVPEPLSIGIFGLAGLALMGRRRA